MTLEQLLRFVVLGLGVSQLGFGFSQRRVQQIGADVREDGALADTAAFVEADVLNRSSELGRDVDFQPRVETPRELDGVFEVLRPELHHGYVDGRRRERNLFAAGVGFRLRAAPRKDEREHNGQARERGA